jgi:hypothetical protein
MKLERKQLTLNTGQTVWCEYDHDGDLLEIIFQPRAATCAIELTESIILRFDWETNEPLSLSFISFSRLVQPTPYGGAHFQLLSDEWPDDVREKVWRMLQHSPLNEFLTVSGYMPAHVQQIIPTTAINAPALAALAA